MSADWLEGMWAMRSTVHPEEDDFMSIDVTRHRIISFIVISADPAKRSPMRFWFRLLSPTSIAASLQPDDLQQSVCGFRLENDHLLLMGNEMNFLYRRVPPAKNPEWMEARLAANHKKMNEVEQGG